MNRTFPFQQLAGYLGCLVLALAAQGGDGLLSGATRLRQAVIPIYLPAESTPAVVVRVEHVHPDLERRGFFRIGLLPMIAAEGVTFEFAASNRLAEALLELDRGIAPQAASRRAELRNVKFLFQPESQPTLHATRVRLARDGEWQLTDGVWLATATGQVHVASARLLATGPRAGEVSWLSPSGPRVMQLFATVGSNSNMTLNRQFQ